MKIKKIDWRWAMLPLFAVIAAAMVTLLAGYTKTETEMLFLTPGFTDAKGWEIYTLSDGEKSALSTQEIPGRAEGTFYLSRTLSPEYEQRGYTYLLLESTRPCTVFLEGSLLYTTCPDSDNRMGYVGFPSDYKPVAGMGEAVRITLPTGYAGKQLTIATMQTDAYQGLPSVQLSGKVIADGEAFSAASGIAMPAAAFAVAALFLLGIFCYSAFTKRWDTSLLLLMLAAFSQCFYHLGQYEYYSAYPSVLAIPLSGFFIPLFVYLPMFYLLCQMKKYRKLSLWIMLTVCALNFIYVGISLYAIPLPDIGFWQLYVPLCILLVFSVLEARDNNPVFRIFCAVSGLTVGVLALTAIGSLLGTGHYFSFIRTLLPYRGFNTRPGAALWICSYLFLLCTIISTLQLIRKTVQMQTEVSVLEMKNSLALEHLHVILESSESLAAARHNMLHHLTAIAKLCDGGEAVRASEYISSLTAETEAITPLRLTENTLVNALLTTAADRAAKSGIRLDIHVDLPSVLPIPDNDLCNFLLNMLDNALEATASLQEEQRVISFTMHIRGRYLFMETENPYCGDLKQDTVSGLFASHKGDGHGYGLKTMQKIARKYQSDLQAEAQKDRFLVRTAFLLPEESGV